MEGLKGVGCFCHTFISERRFGQRGVGQFGVIMTHKDVSQGKRLGSKKVAMLRVSEFPGYW